MKWVRVGRASLAQDFVDAILCLERNWLPLFWVSTLKGVNSETFWVSTLNRLIDMRRSAVMLVDFSDLRAEDDTRKLQQNFWQTVVPGAESNVFLILGFSEWT